MILVTTASYTLGTATLHSAQSTRTASFQTLTHTQPKQSFSVGVCVCVCACVHVVHECALHALVIGYTINTGTQTTCTEAPDYEHTGPTKQTSTHSVKVG